MAKFYPSDEDSETMIHKERSKFKECEENRKKHRKENSSLYCSLHGENKTHTSRECNILKKRAKYKELINIERRITKIRSKKYISCKQQQLHRQQENNWLDSCIDAFIIDKLKPNSKSKIK